MQIETAILAPAAILAGWTMIVFLWLIARRMPAFAAAGIKVGGAALQQDQLDLAWNAYVAANRIGARPFNPDAYDEYVNQIMAAYPSAVDTEQEVLAEDVVLVVGPPRTGSTLLERILDAHPDAHGLGEISLAAGQA